jgi:hypothetical protein
VEQDRALDERVPLQHLGVARPYLLAVPHLHQRPVDDWHPPPPSPADGLGRGRQRGAGPSPTPRRAALWSS